ncbi:MAG: hypothetical protein IKE69_06285 [Thermoguttaceae bacterium]|nr:hypothetical protein [Thermoguttaceae bacterium]
MSVKKFFEFVSIISGLFFLYLLFLGVGGRILVYDAHFAKDLRTIIYIISTVSLYCGLVGLVELLINGVKKIRRAKRINQETEYQKTDVVAERKRLNLFLVIVAVLSPFVAGLGFGCGVLSVFMAEGLINWWTVCFAALSWFLFFGAGLVGLASAVALLIINRKQKKSPLVWFALLLLILVNFCVNAPTLVLLFKMFVNNVIR